MQLEDANMRIYTMDIQDGKERRGIQGNNSCKLPTVTENYGLHIQKNQHTPSRKNTEAYTKAYTKACRKCWYYNKISKIFSSEISAEAMENRGISECPT